MRLFDTILKFYSHKYFIGPACLTLTSIIILFSVYSSNSDFDMAATFFGYCIMVDALLVVMFAHQIFNGKKDFMHLFAISFISLILSFLALMFCKTLSFFALFSSISAILAIFVFFAMFKYIVDKILDYNTVD